MLKIEKPDIVNKLIDDLISNLSLKEKSTIANMELSLVKALDFIFQEYIESKVGIGPEDAKEYSLIITGLWEKLQENYKLRVVK